MAKQGKYITDGVLLGQWDEVQNLPLSSITKNTSDTELLDGLVLRGYEMKWDTTNENGERYERDCFDEFIKSYYVEKGLNVPLDIQHRNDIDHLAGRIIYIETNTVGFYVVGYIPRDYIHYDAVRMLVRNGILQGFSKFGWASDYKCVYKSDGSFDYELVKKCTLLAVSLVSTPANGMLFEKMDEIRRNALTYRNTQGEDPRGTRGGTLEDMFNKKCN